MKKLVWAFVAGLAMSASAMAQETLDASGQVVSVRLITRTITVRDTQFGEVFRYEVPWGTPVSIAGGQARLGHLRSGDRVELSYLRTDEGRQATRLAVPSANPTFDQRVRDGLYSTVTGQVVAVNYGQRTVTVVSDQTGGRFSYPVPEATRVSIAGENARFGNLRRGDKVVLRFKSDEQPEVARIRVPETRVPVAQRPVQAASTAVAAEPLPAMLPRTASLVPLMGLFGVLSLLGAAGLRSVRRMRARG